MEPPKDWLQMIENIRTVRRKYPAPVDSMGCDQVSESRIKDMNQRFQVLVSLMLSSQTKDPITWAAVQKLKTRGICNVDGLLDAREKDIEDLIYPVGFYRRKAIYLKKVAAILKEQYSGDIPDTLEALCKLPGVGPKMAHLCMQEAWNVNSGIGVDTHVHRISARLGWVPAKDIKTPEHTRIALESWLPSEYWREINHLLVGFGQTICTPVRPKCDECANNGICPSAKLGKSASRQKSNAAVSPKTKKEPYPSIPDATLKDSSPKQKVDPAFRLIKNEPVELSGGITSRKRGQKPRPDAALITVKEGTVEVSDPRLMPEERSSKLDVDMKLEVAGRDSAYSSLEHLADPPEPAATMNLAKKRRADSSGLRAKSTKRQELDTALNLVKKEPEEVVGTNAALGKCRRKQDSVVELVKKEVAECDSAYSMPDLVDRSNPPRPTAQVPAGRTLRPRTKLMKAG